MVHRNIENKFYMIKNRILIIIISLFLFGCSGNSIHHFYSPSKDQSITVITNEDIRYIISGIHNSVPKSNFVKLDLKKVDRGAGDQIVGCWNRENLNWIIVMDDVTVLENKLEPKRYKFLNQFPVDNRGIPTLVEYLKKDCFSISLEYRNLNRIEGAIRTE